VAQLNYQIEHDIRRFLKMIKIHLSKIMGAKRINIQALSELTKLSRSTISNIYNEKVNRIDLDTISSLCKVLECKIDDLLEYIPD